MKAAKKTLKHLGDSNSFTFEEKQVLLMMAKKCLNDRPIGAKFRNGVDPGYSPITPNLLVHGYYEDKDVSEMTGDLESIGDLAKRIKLLQARHAAWWEKWYQECFEQLMPLPKWKVANRNLQPGDVCLLGYHSGLGPGVYRLCRVTKTFLDGEGLVRTVEVVLRPRRNDDHGTNYKPCKLQTMVVGIQRLVLIHRNEDIHETTDSDDLSPRVRVNHVEAYWPLISEIMTDFEYEDKDLHGSLDDAIVSEVDTSDSSSALALTSNFVQAELHGVDVSTVTPILVSVAPISSVNILDSSIGPNDLTDPDDAEHTVDLVPEEPNTETMSIRFNDD